MAQTLASSSSGRTCAVPHSSHQNAYDLLVGVMMTLPPHLGHGLLIHLASGIVCPPNERRAP